MSYKIDWQGANLIVEFYGVVTYSEINEADSIVYGSERFDQMEYQVFDFINIEDFNLSDQEMKMIGALDKASTRWNNNVKVAIITDNEKIIELTEIYKKIMEGSNWKTRIFKSMEEALRWCNVAIFSPILFALIS